MKRWFLMLGILTALSRADQLPPPEGRWEVAHTDGKPFTIVLQEDHSATSDWGEGEVGTWLVIEGLLFIDWTDGWRDVIFSRDGKLVKWAWGPGVERSEPPTNKTTARKL